MRWSPFATLLAAAPVFAQETGEVAPPDPGRNTVALVVGLSSYANLPDAVELDFARSDAALIAKTLREEGRFTQVFLLADGEASRERIRETIRTEVAQLAGPGDLFVLYFVGHGIGADLDLPTFLAFDSTLENGQEDGLELQSIARDMQTWTGDATRMIVTDVIHRNQLDGIYFYGPSADQWPGLGDKTAIISSSERLEPATDGAFGAVFAKALAGAADGNGDTHVTIDELFRYVHDDLGPKGQIPVIAGTYSGNTVLTSGVDRSRFASDEPTGTEEPEEYYPDVDIDKAKFVFLEGQAQTVSCRNSSPIECAPSCYVWDFKGGPCRVGAVIDGFPMEGSVVVLGRGRYRCRRQGPNLACAGPD